MEKNSHRSKKKKRAPDHGKREKKREGKTTLNTKLIMKTLIEETSKGDKKQAPKENGPIKRPLPNERTSCPSEPPEGKNTRSGRNKASNESWVQSQEMRTRVRGLDKNNTHGGGKS